MQQGQQQAINISPEDTTGINCPKCNSEYFIPVYMLRKISALLSPSGQEEMLQVPVMACANCGSPYLGDQPEEVEEESKIIV